MTNFTSKEYIEILKDYTGDADDLNVLSGTSVTNTELEYLSGVLNPIQTQLNDKLEPSDLGDYVNVLQTGNITTTFTTLNTDDDTSGLKISSINIPEDAVITGVVVRVSQGSGGSDNTLEVIINDTDDGVSPISTIISSFGCDSAVKQSFNDSVDVGYFTTSATNQYVVLLYKDVNDNDDATTDLIVEMRVYYHNI